MVLDGCSAADSEDCSRGRRDAVSDIPPLSVLERHRCVVAEEAERTRSSAAGAVDLCVLDVFAVLVSVPWMIFQN